MLRRLSVLAMLSLLLPLQLVFGQSAVTTPTGSVRPLEQILGYQLGEQLTDDATLQRFLEELAATSKRVRLIPYAQTHEGRRLNVLIVTSEQNVARLDAIREGLVRLSDPRKTTSEDAERLASELPVAVWLAYSVHGNEHSGTEAAIGVAHRLATTTDPEMLKLLDSALVLIDPCENPDGRARFINNFRSNVGRHPNPEPYAMEHGPAWGSPRSNHYYFDLNRDWFILSQPETYGRAEIFRQWPGQVYGDFHEMGSSSTYFFYPPATPVHPVFDDSTKNHWASFGVALAAAFDKEGLPYYTAEEFDAFYPGYGDTWPTLQGAIGMTFEQASTRGLVVRRDDETIMKYSDSVRGHTVASIATIQHAVEKKRDLLLHTWRFRHDAMAASSKTLPKQIFLLPQTDPLCLETLLRNLKAQGIEAERVTTGLQLDAAFTPRDAATKSAEVPAGSIQIETAQPNRALLQALFETTAPLPDSFVAEERQKLLRGEPSGFYDITAWSLPLTMGLVTLYTNESVDPQTEPVVTPPAAEPQLDPAPYAVLLPWTGRAPSALFSLLNAGIPVRVATKEFKLNGRNYGTGTFVVVGQRVPGFREALAKLPVETRRELVGSATGSTESGPDLGSGSLYHIKTPKIVLVGDQPTDASSYGAFAYLLDVRYGIPYTSIRMEDLSSAELNRYNVIILPDGSESGYRRALEQAKDEVSAWIRGGGVLVGTAGSAAALADESLGLTEVRLVKAPAKDDAKAAESKPDSAATPQATPTGSPTPKPAPPPGSTEQPHWPIQTPGAILLTEVNRQSYLGFGLPTELPVLFASDRAFVADEERRDPIRFVSDTEKLRVSGHLWPEAAEKIKGTPFAVDVPIGRGRAVLLIEDPTFRALLWQEERILLNAILLGPSQ